MKRDKATTCFTGVSKAGLLGLLPLMAISLIVLGAAFAARASACEPYDLAYFDGHMHTVESDGSGTVDDIKAEALERGLSAVIVTNHTKMLTLDEWKYLNQKARALSSRGFLMLNAFEVTGSEGLFNRDHVLAWGVADPFVGRDADELAPLEVWESPANPNGTGALHPANIARWTDYIHRHGGIAVHAHTTGTTNPVYGVDFIELFNLSHVKDVASYAAMMGFPQDKAWGLGLTLNNMAIYGERDLRMPVALPGVPTLLPLRDALYAATRSLTGTGQLLGAPEAPLHSWDDLLMAYVRGELDHPTFGVADSDAHNTANIAGRQFTDSSDVGEAKNGVLVERLTPRCLLEAIKAGRCFATTGPSMTFTVDGRTMGQTARVKTWRDRSAKLQLSVDSKSTTAVIAQVTIVKNGEVWRTFAPMTPAFHTLIRDDAAENGYYRVEVVAVETTSGQYQFGYSNPVFVKTFRASCPR